MRRFLPLLWSLLFALSLLGCVSQAQVDASTQWSQRTLQSLHERHPQAFTAKVCVLPDEVPAGTRFLLADARRSTFVSDRNREAFERFLPFADTIFEFDLFARSSSAALLGAALDLSCPETFEVLRAPEDVEDGESRFQTVTRIPTKAHTELRSIVEQTCKAAELQRTDRLYVGQQTRPKKHIVLGVPTPPEQARILRLLGIEKIPEPEPSGPQSLTRQLIDDTREGQQLAGFARGTSKAVIPGGTIAVDLAREAHWLPEGTRTARIAESCAEFGVGVIQLAVGCTGIVAGTGMTGTGGGAPVGVPVLAGSIVLTAAGAANCGNSIRHLTIELWRSDDSDGMVSSSPPSESSPAKPAPQTAKPEPKPEPVATPEPSPPVTKAPGAGQTTPRNVHLAGKKHPKTGVPFDKDGYPDFRAAGIVKAEVKIKFTGSREKDELLANKQAGLSQRTPGHTWHHHQDGTTMQLVPTEIHKQTGHTGGFSATSQ